MRLSSLFLLAAGLLAAGSSSAADTATASPRKVAIIVENRAGAQLNDKVAVFEDLLSSRIAGKGYSIISRDVTLNALKTYPSVGVAVSGQTAVNASADAASHSQSGAAGTAQAQLAQAAAVRGKAEDNAGTQTGALDLARTDSAQLTAGRTNLSSGFGQGSASLNVSQSDSAKFAVTPDTTKLDQALSDSTSALRLAQNLGADFILIPSLTTYGTEKKTYNADGISTINVTYTLRVSCKIVEAGEGGAIKGGMATATKTLRQSANLQVDSSEVINDLLDDAANQLADTLVSAAAALPATVAKDKQVSFSIACTMTDIKDQPLTVPNVQVTADKRVVKTNAPIEVQPLDVTVELDGIAIGSAPGTFQAFPGLHKLRLSREGFKDWERTVNLYAGQKLHVAMQLSDAGYNRWKDNVAFLQLLQDDQKLTDAEVKRIEGIAKFFSESHYRVDTKENVKIYKSLY
ncbi:MAG TPA: PEGA domain-containing protein [Candidatus Acidoferrum sp.]|nr:PEGA domain-containing protein [Candidatus Acidoferrum sp.]